ncbi:MAG: glycosyltransferase, partial [Methanobacterium sp.]
PALTAINYNLPIIASDLKCFTDLIDPDVDGFLFEKENVLSLCNTLEKALDLTSLEYLKIKEKQKEKMELYKNEESSIGEVFNAFIQYNMFNGLRNK